MAYGQSFYSSGGGGIPAQLQTDMDSVLNKKLGTSTTYPSTSWAKEVNLMGLLPEKTVSGSVASFADGADDVPIKTATFDIDPTLDGVSEVNVVRTGANICNQIFEVGDIDASTGQNNDSNVVIRTKDYISVRPETQYFIHIGDGSDNSTTVRTRFYDKNKNYLGYNQYGGTTVKYNRVFKTPTDCYYMRFTPNAAYGTTYNDDISVNYPSTDTSYHSYNGITRTISLGQTVYGGSVTVDEDGNCDLDDGYGIVVFDSNSSASDFEISVVEGQTNRIAWTPYQNIGKVGSKNFLSDVLATSDSYTSRPPAWTVSGSSASYARCFIGIPNTIDTVQKWLDYVAENPITLVYEKSTPTTSTLTPITPITSALGVNNIWCDTGDVETLTYRTPEVIPIPCLSSGGNQAITLPIYDDGGYTFKFKLYVFAPQMNTLILGGYWDAGCLLFHTYKAGGNYVLYYYPSNTPISVPLTVGKWLDVELAPSYIKVDGVTYQGTAASRYHNQTRLFAYDNAYGSAIAISEMKVYDSNDVLVLDLVPQKNADGSGYFRDTVNGTNYSSTQQPNGYLEL